MFEWLSFSLVFLSLWLIIYAVKKPLRRKMLVVGVFTSFWGFLEPVFVPAYWTPPSLFNLALNTHFDIESFIFSFATGGIASVLYEMHLRGEHQKITHREVHDVRRSLHLTSILLAPIIFAVLLGFTKLNPIYAVSIGFFFGSVAATICRPDLMKNTWVSGLLFAGLYFVFFSLTTLAFPSFVNAWNLPVLSGILILNVPLEEIMFAFTFGMLWAGGYDHAMGYKVIR